MSPSEERTVSRDRGGRSTRRRMIEAAGRLFQSQGYHGTGLQQILRESRAPRGSLYFHFPGGKEELAADAARAAGDEMLARLVETAGSLDDLAAALDAVVDLLGRDLEESGYTRGCPVATLALESGGSERVRNACAGVYERWCALLAGALERAGRTPEAAREEALLLLASLEGALVLARARRSLEPLRAVARGLRERLAEPPA